MNTGLSYTSTLLVSETQLAAHVGSGDLKVFATPAMAALMENAAMMAVKNELEEGQTTVGGHLNISHIKPTAEGQTVKATATLTAIEGRKLTFRVIAEDENGIIGEGEHLRFIVDKNKFMSKLKK